LSKQSKHLGQLRRFLSSRSAPFKRHDDVKIQKIHKLRRLTEAAHEHQLVPDEVRRMLSHVSIGVRDLANSRRFYDAALEPLGYKCLVEGPEYLGYGAEAPEFWLLAVKRPVPANNESGLHFCFDAPRRTAVDEFHRAATGAGGSDNGRPGLRKDYGDDYYAAFVTDPDGYRLEAYTSSAD
jgi:catechol 2,3-dioxygenase-like lactoylglutathione lyase family enzyme